MADPFISHSSMVILLLLSGGFVKAFTATQILRIGFSLYGSSVGVLVVLFSLVASLFIVQSSTGIDVLRQIEQPSELKVLEEKLRPLLIAHVPESRLEQVEQTAELFAERYNKNEDASITTESEPVVPAADSEAKIAEPPATLTLLFAVMLEELQQALKLGLLFLLPFLVIDVLVAHLLQLLGVTQIPSLTIALPLKLLLFIVLDGWMLFSYRLFGVTL